jgi:predicted negative regulator of RcsB-dependent stress response
MSEQESPSVAFYRALAWIEANLKPLIIAFIAIVIVGFSIAAYRWQNERTERAASDALLRLKSPARSAESESGPDASAYLKVAEEYRGTSAARRALLLAASAMFAQNNYADAQAQFEKFSREHSQSSLAPIAAYGAAASMEAQSRADEALAAYQNLSVRYPNSPLSNDAKLSMARIHEIKGQPEQALRIYNELIKPIGQREAGNEAMQRREYLLVRNPELAQTNAPSTGPTSQLEAPATGADLSLANTNNSVAQP